METTEERFLVLWLMYLCSDGVHGRRAVMVHSTHASTFQFDLCSERIQATALMLLMVAAESRKEEHTSA
jgi:hypothetical protein